MAINYRLPTEAAALTDALTDAGYKPLKPSGLAIALTLFVSFRSMRGDAFDPSAPPFLSRSPSMIRIRSLRSAATAFIALAFASSIAIAAVLLHDLTGTWDFEVITENGTGTPTVRLMQKGDKLTGTYESRMMGVRTIAGAVKGDSITFVLGTSGESTVVMTYAGKIVDADHLEGTVDFGGMGGALFKGTRRK